MAGNCGNATLDAWNNMTGDKQLYINVYTVLYGYGLPTICAFGFLGNVLNLIILAGKRIQRSLRKMERSANIGLISLAVADLCFCLSAFPSTFLPQNNSYNSKGFLLYYACYCAAVINIFIMTSTLLTVTMATERYLAICHPLKSRNLISLDRTKFVIISVYIFSGLFNIPVFWRYTIMEVSCDNTTTVFEVQPTVVINESFDHTYRAAWAIIGNFIPLALLLFSNVALMKEIHKSYAFQRKMNGNLGNLMRNHHEQEANNRITRTLVAIVLLFFILVAPSELLKHVAYLTGGQTLQYNYTYLTIEIITNIMQTMNFSSNFILYCIIHKSFRKTMKEMLCFRRSRFYNPESCFDRSTNSTIDIRRNTRQSETFYGPSSSRMANSRISLQRLSFTPMNQKRTSDISMSPDSN